MLYNPTLMPGLSDLVPARCDSAARLAHSVRAPAALATTMLRLRKSRRETLDGLFIGLPPLSQMAVLDSIVFWSFLTGFMISAIPSVSPERGCVQRISRRGADRRTSCESKTLRLVRWTQPRSYEMRIAGMISLAMHNLISLR